MMHFAFGLIKKVALICRLRIVLKTCLILVTNSDFISTLLILLVFDYVGSYKLFVGIIEPV